MPDVLDRRPRLVAFLAAVVSAVLVLTTIASTWITVSALLHVARESGQREPFVGWIQLALASGVAFALVELVGCAFAAARVVECALDVRLPRIAANLGGMMALGAASLPVALHAVATRAPGTLGPSVAISAVLAGLCLGPWLARAAAPWWVLGAAVRGRHAAAVERLTWLVAIDDGLLWMLPTLAGFDGNTTLALASYDASLAVSGLDPSFEADLRWGRAELCLDADRLDEVDRELSRLRELHVDPAVLAARLAVRTGAVTAADLDALRASADAPVGWLTRLTGFDPRAERRADLAWASAVAGQRATARTELDLALAEVDRASPLVAARALLRLGRAAEALGDRTTAGALWRRGQAADPGAAGVRCAGSLSTLGAIAG